MNLFKELFKFGFSNLEEVKVYEDKDKEEKTQNEYKQIQQISIEELLYDRKYECPICGCKFTSKAVRSGKNRYIRSDTDLKAYYTLLDPSLYEVIHCGCGYTGLSRNFYQVSTVQKQLIQEQICKNFKQPFKEQYRTVEDAVVLYKLALLNAIVKKSKIGERAYICLKIAWLYRDLKNEEEERAFIEKAVEGFEQSLGKEQYPLYNIDEYMVMYIMIDLYRRLGKKTDAMRYLSALMQSQASERLKDKARDLKELIKELA
ncbi:MAG: DUF2225 domain-containing protein [Cellulosilyticaceae bacterium]